MRIEDIRIWQWMLIGLVLGLLMAWTRFSWEPKYQTGPMPVGKSGFEEALAWDRESMRNPIQRENPPLRNIVIYPQPRDFVVVQFERLEQVRGEWGYHTRQMFAAQPYEPAVAAPGLAGSYPTFKAYMDAMAGMYDHVSYRHAWWKKRPMAAALWGLGGMAVVGGVWPLMLNLLIGAGFGRKAEGEPEPAYDLGRFGQGAAGAAQARAGMSDADRAQLDGTLEALEAEVGAGQSPDDRPPAEQPTPVRELDGAPLEAVEEAQAEAKAYDGEFYPTEAHALHAPHIPDAPPEGKRHRS